MSYLAKQRLFYYKKYKTDIWGFLHNTLQVLHDDTIYKVHKTYKYQKRLNKRLKETTWVLLKYENKYNNKEFCKIDSKLDLLKFKLKDKSKIIKKFEKLRTNFKYIKYLNKRYLEEKKYRQQLINKIISTGYRWNFFIKETISKRLCNVFNILIEQKTEEIKIFYRRPFIYEPRVAMPSTRKRLRNVEFTTFRLLKVFFVIYSHNQLRRIAYRAKLKSGVFEHNFLSIIESKLPSYIYRSSLFPTLFESLDFVKKSNVWVNKQYQPLVFYNVKLFDIVGFRPFYKSYIIWAFFKRLRRRAFLFSFPSYVYVSLSFLFIILIKHVKMRDIINSFEFDYFRLSDYLP